MKEITGYNLRSDDGLHQFLHEAYAQNKGVIIPADMLKDFVEVGCRITIARVAPFNKSK